MHTPMSQMDAVTPVLHLLPKQQNGDIKRLPLQTMQVPNHSLKHIVQGKRMGLKFFMGLKQILVDDGVPIAYNEAHRMLAKIRMLYLTLRRRDFLLSMTRLLN